MWIVDRGIQVVRSLSEHERDLLVGFAQSALRGQDVERCNSLLRSIRGNGHWIGCDCQKPMPILNVALQDSGRLLLRNNPEGVLHAEKCIFAHDDKQPSKAKSGICQEVIRFSNDSPIALHVEFQPSSKGEVHQISRSNAPRARGRKRLLSFLLSLMDSAGLTVYRPSSKWSLSEQYAALRTAAQQFTLSPGLPLGSYLDTRISRKGLFALATKLKQAKEFGAHRRAGLLLDRIESVKGRSVVPLNGDGMDFFGHVERAASCGHPALGLASVTTIKPGSQFYELGNIALVPILSGTCMFPVNDEHERPLLLDLFSLLDWMYQSKGVEVSAVRHPFAEEDAHLVELRSTKMILRVDLSEGIPTEAPPPAGLTTLQLSTMNSFASLKKLVASRFLGSIRE